MTDDLIGRTLRALRHRRGWRQSDLASTAEVARSVIGDLEAGRLDRHTLGALRRSLHATGASLRLVVDVPGGDLRRLLDADHARLQAHWLEALRRSGWHVEPEVTFSVYGERGSIDLLAWHPATRMLLVIELKTVIVDIGSLLGILDRKARLAPTVARERGWLPSSVVPALLVLDGSTARRRIAELAPLFRGFALRGRAALTWMRNPAGAAPSGILAFCKLADARPGDRRRAGRQRMRVRRVPPRSAGGQTAASARSRAV